MGKLTRIFSGIGIAASLCLAPAMAQGALKEFKLAIQSPYSGPAAQTGNEVKNGVTWAFDEINWTVGKYKIVPVWVDCQSDPAKATNAYEQAIVQQHVQAGLMNWHSSVAVALMEITAKYKIPHMLGTGSTEIINEKFHSNVDKYGYWMLKSWPIPYKLSGAYVEALEAAIKAGTYKPKNNKTVVLYAEDTDFGRSFSNGSATEFRKAGWKVLDQEYFPMGQTEFYPLLNKIKALHADVVCGSGTAEPAVTAFVKQADEVGLEGILIADALGYFGDWYKLCGPASDLVLDEIPSWGSAKGKTFATAYKAKYGIPPSPATTGIGYDSAKFFIKLCNDIQAKGQPLTSETIYKFVKENIWTGKWAFTDGIVMKRYRYTPETIPDPVMGPNDYIFPVIQYHKGVGKILFPTEWAEAKLELKR